MSTSRSLWGLVSERAAETPDALMMVDEHDRTMSFAEYKDAAERTAAGLSDLGLTAGDVVAWQLTTWIESAILVAALSRLGVTQNPILPIYREREVGFCTKQAGAKMAIVPSTWNGIDFQAIAEKVAEDNGQGMSVLVADKVLPQGDPATLPPEPTEAGADEVRWLFYTSGTTADPKGAQHTDASIAAIGSAMGERLRCGPESRNGMVFPFTHIGGITWLFTSLQTQCANIFIEAFVPDLIVTTLGKHGVTHAGAGTVFHQTYLAAQKAADQPIFPDVTCFPGGGAPKPPQLHFDLIEAFPMSSGVLSGYGLTEAPILTMCDFDMDDDALATTEGYAMPGVDLRLVTVEGEPAGTGEEGEVRAKAPQLMKGYLDASLDADAFDDDGYFRTGDLGRLDDKGHLVVTGRLKDVIIRKGENVSAKEVEDALYGNDKVGDVAVIGLPDERSGERVCAVVQTAEGQDDLTMEEMVEHCKGTGMMMQKVPEQLEIIDAIPRNPAGKILKHVLKEQYWG